MRFLTWLLGVFVLLLALESSVQGARGWLWVWIPGMVVWFFAGIGLACFALAKLVTGKIGAGGLGRFKARSGDTPAPHKEE